MSRTPKAERRDRKRVRLYIRRRRRAGWIVFRVGSAVYEAKRWATVSLSDWTQTS